MLTQGKALTRVAGTRELATVLESEHGQAAYRATYGRASGREREENLPCFPLSEYLLIHLIIYAHNFFF